MSSASRPLSTRRGCRSADDMRCSTMPQVSPPATRSVAYSSATCRVLHAVRASGFGDVLGITGTGPVVVLARVNGRGQQPLVSADIELGPAEITPQDLPPLRGVQVSPDR